MTASALRADIQSLVDSFVGQLEDLVRQAALETVTQLLQPTAPAPALVAAAKRGPGRPPRALAAAAPAAKAAPKAAAPRAASPRAAAPTAVGKTAGKPAKSGGRIRRSTEQIEAAGERIVRHVEGHQGVKAEEIRAALSLAKNEWTLTVKRLVDTGKLTTKGEKRATQYFTRNAPRFGVIRRPGRGAAASASGEGQSPAAG